MVSNQRIENVNVVKDAPRNKNKQPIRHESCTLFIDNVAMQEANRLAGNPHRPRTGSSPVRKLSRRPIRLDRVPMTAIIAGPFSIDGRLWHCYLWPLGCAGGMTVSGRALNVPDRTPSGVLRQVGFNASRRRRILPPRRARYRHGFAAIAWLLRPASSRNVPISLQDLFRRDL